jgi:hypothetical protein
MAAAECLENVRVHAYRRRSEAPHRRRGDWFIVGLHDPQTQQTQVAILDLGFGIVSTASKQLSRVNKLWESWFRGPEDILEDVSLGMRTESGERKHGKGLSTLRTFVCRAASRTLNILSSSGMISWTQAGCAKRPISLFRGTIVCLTFQSGEDIK